MRLSTKQTIEKATEAQQNYMEVLFNDVGISERAKRNDFLSLRVGREIHYLTDLTKTEASDIITELKLKKHG